MRTRILLAIVVGALALAGVKVAGGEPAFEPSVAADPADGAALVREAIENVRAAERFRYTQSSGGRSASGTVDLSSGSGDEPRHHGKLNFKRPDGSPVVLEEVVVGDQVHVRPPGGAFRRSARLPARARGKARGGGVVDVRDPVMMLLDPLSELSSDDFATPVADGDVWRVAVGQIGVTLIIDDAQHLVRRVEVAAQGQSMTIELRDFADPSATVESPA